MRGAFLGVCLAVVGSAMGCKRPSESGSAPPPSSSTVQPVVRAKAPRVAVSIFPIYDITRRVAGDRLEVVLVLPPGRSEHDYDPAPKDIARVADAKLGLSVGLDMDGWLERIVRGAAGPSVPIVQLGPKASPIKVTLEDIGEEAVEEARKKQKGKGEPEEKEHEHGALDPHFWLDPVRMQGTVDVLVEALSGIDQEGQAGIRERGEAVKASLGKLHTEIADRRKTWTKKTIVTFHGSMAYFAARYDLTIAAVLEPFPGKEPTPRYLKDVLSAIKKSGAAALFSEPQLDPRPAKVVADQSKIPLFELDPVGGGPGRETYEALQRSNVEVLDKALR